MTAFPPLTPDQLDALRQFVKARLDEAEVAAKAAAEDHQTPHWGFSALSGNVTPDTGGNAYVAVGPWDCNIDEASGSHIARWDPARVLAEVHAKRQLLGWCETGALPDYEIEFVLCALATPDADHPDFKQEWKV